jgi:hypothetical protein
MHKDDLAEDLSEIPAWLITPPTDFPSAPVTTRAQKLPFGELRWENFERLCTRLERTQADIECCRLYGTSGQAQKGIDLYFTSPVFAKIPGSSMQTG